jgi:hypothetical protein
MKTFNIRMLVILFVILIILLALSVYIKPLLELYTSEINVDIDGETYTGTVRRGEQYEIDIDGTTHTGFIDTSNNSGRQPPIVNQNFVVTGQSGRALNDIYMPGTTGSSGGQHTSPLDFLSTFFPTTGMYTAGTNVPDNAGGLLPNADDASQTTFGIPEAEESQLGTLGVDYNKCMEGDHVLDLEGGVEPIGTFFYIRDYGNGLSSCAEQVAPCAQFNNQATGLGNEERCTSFASRSGRKLCNFTPAVTRTVTAADGTTSQVVDTPSNCSAIPGLNPTYMVDAPVPSSTDDTTSGSASEQPVSDEYLAGTGTNSSSMYTQ